MRHQAKNGVVQFFFTKMTKHGPDAQNIWCKGYIHSELYSIRNVRANGIFLRAQLAGKYRSIGDDLTCACPCT